MPSSVTHTTHIFPTDDGWIVLKDRALDQNGIGDRAKSSARRVPSPNAVYSTQKQAIDVARKIAQRETMAQVVVHSRTGSMRRPYVHGFPIRRKLPVKSELGTKAIEQAVSIALRKRLVGE
jgi:hypothetical protein